MKKFVGKIIAYIGAYLWEKGGFWNENQQYENLTVFGKLGYNMFVKGLSMTGITEEKLMYLCATNLDIEDL